MIYVILAVCVVFGSIIQQSGRIIKKRGGSKWLTINLQIIIYWVSLMVIYGIIALSDFNIGE